MQVLAIEIYKSEKCLMVYKGMYELFLIMRNAVSVVQLALDWKPVRCKIRKE